MMNNMIRVGRFRPNAPNLPYYEDYLLILPMKGCNSGWWPLSPDSLSLNDCILENIWQSSKVYESVPYTVQRASKNGRVIWRWPAETHVEDGQITAAYVKWRNALLHADYPINHPIGPRPQKPVYYLADVADPQPLDEIEARKQIYLPIYAKLVRADENYQILLQKIRNGTNVLIAEVDGPHQESLHYYKSKYGVNDSFISKYSMPATFENLNIMLNDAKHPFGHGYCLACVLLEDLYGYKFV